LSLPEDATTISTEHRVAFYETDGMGIVHHSNYLRFFENARVIWLETHDKSYPDWIAMGLHFAVTHAQLDYKQPARFDDMLRVTTWLEWLRGASLAMAYQIECAGVMLVTGRTEHASINDEGRVRRIPKQDRERLGKLVLPEFRH
jgi:acyl-CoA thioester hydrolase